jgi:hypothetical protein
VLLTLTTTNKNTWRSTFFGPVQLKPPLLDLEKMMHRGKIRTQVIAQFVSFVYKVVPHQL